MEVIRSAEYKPDDQIAMMYIRDINDEYLKQLDKIIRHAKDAFASVTVNISDGSCIMRREHGRPCGIPKISK